MLSYLEIFELSLGFFKIFRKHFFNIDRNPNNRIRSLILTKHRINDFFPSFELINCPNCSQIFKCYQYYPCQNHFFIFSIYQNHFYFPLKYLCSTFTIEFRSIIHNQSKTWEMLKYHLLKLSYSVDAIPNTTNQIR